MGNEVREVENTKDNTAKSGEDNQVSYLSVINDIGRAAVLGGVGCAAAAGISEACKTASGTDSALKTGLKIGQAVAEGAVMGAVPVLTLAAGSEIAKQARATAGGAIEAAKAGANAILNDKNACEIKDVAKEVAVGAAIGGVVGACTGDTTRAIAAAAIGGIAAGARKVMDDCCCKSKTLSPIEAVKQMGRDTWDHMKNRPVESIAEGLLLGPGGIMAGAAIHKMMEKKDLKDCCNPAEMNKKLNEKLNDRSDVIKDLLKNPFVVPVLTPVGGIPVEAIKRASKLAGTGPVPGVEATRETIKEAAKTINSELEQHRKENPTASAVERAAGYAVGGVIGGKLVGTAFELNDIAQRKAYDYVKSWFK